MFGTENEGFCDLMKLFFGCIAVATETENGKISMQNLPADRQVRNS